MEDVTERAGDGSGGGRGVEIIENVELAGEAVLLAPSPTAVILDKGVAGAGEGRAVDILAADDAVVEATALDLATVVTKPPTVLTFELVLAVAPVVAGTID